MKISLNTIRGLNEKYNCTGDIAAIGVNELVEKIGAQLGGVDEVIDLGAKYQGIIVAKVVECVKHPDADKLSLCKIDDGNKAANVQRDEQGRVQVVCGAPNVRAGLTVAWLPPGATVPESFDKDPFVLEAREIRGQKSNGMLASPRELALGDSHEGILELPDALNAGDDFAEVTGLNDTIIDIENKMFTHRPDCFGFLGVSRELAGIQSMPFKSPEWYTPNPEFPGVEGDALPLTIKNELPELVPRFTALTMSDIRVGPSPLWLQVFLAEMGQKSINNIVDYTNFYMLETGQPLHAYDYDKVKALSGGEASIVVRYPRKGEKIKLLNGKEIEPRAEAIMITTGQHLIGLAGVMGGSETEVDPNTKNIILECGNFDMYSVRRASMEHGVFTDASTRFTKGQSPLQNLAVLAKITDEIRQNAGGKVASPVLDDNHLSKEVLERGSLYPAISLSADFVNVRLGLKLSADEMSKLLENVEFKVMVNGDQLTVLAPFWRTDIEVPEDVVEEVGRLYGYDHLPLELPKRDLTPAQKDPMLSLKAQIRAALAKGGANELLTYSFVHGDLLQKVGQNPAKAFQLSNALSPDLQYYRLSLTPSILDKVHPNIKAGYGEFAIFELGKAHQIGLEEDGIPTELERLALVFAADTKSANQYSGAAFYEARKFLMNLLGGLNLTNQVKFEANERSAYFEPGRSATLKINDKTLGKIGEYKAGVRRALKLPDFSAGFEIDLDVLLKSADGFSNYAQLPGFPKVTQDITLKVSSDLPHGELSEFVFDQVQAVAPGSFFELSPVNIYQADDDSSHKNVSLRLTIASYERTLTDTEVNKWLDAVAVAAKDKFDAERV